MLGNLMSAVEAHNIPKKIRAEKLEKQIKSYARQIEDAASRGEFYVSCDGEQMSSAARKYLEKHGYTVTTSTPDREPYWEISWKVEDDQEMTE